MLYLKSTQSIICCTCSVHQVIQFGINYFCEWERYLKRPITLAASDSNEWHVVVTAQADKDYHPPCGMYDKYHVSNKMHWNKTFIVLNTVDVMNFNLRNISKVICHLFNLDLGITT